MVPSLVAGGFDRVAYWLKGEDQLNFGDALTELFISELLVAPKIEEARYRLIGSVIAPHVIEDDLRLLSRKPGIRIAFWCCGLREDRPIESRLLDRTVICGSRGPLTRDALGMPKNSVVGDTGFLVPLLHRPKASRTNGQRICVPHIFERLSPKDIISGTNVDLVISPRIDRNLSTLRSMIDDIAGAEFVLAGSLHAAIVAAAYKRPFAFWNGSRVDVPFKWLDVAASLRIPPLFFERAKQGEEAYWDIISPKIRLPSLAKILSVCPFHVKREKLNEAAAMDEQTGEDA
jgi:hypothetical protein